MRHCETQQKFADLEIERIQKQKLRVSQVEAELERYVVQVIEQFAVPDQRGVKHLKETCLACPFKRIPIRFS